MRIIFSGGGTGGHIYPALALIKSLRQKDSKVEILYIGKLNSQEEQLCKKENIPFKGIKVRYFYRKFVVKNFMTVYEFIKAYRHVKKIIKQFKPDVIIGTGGYVCAPVVYAGAKKHIKTIIHEQNSIPGLTNKFLSRYVNVVAISFLSSKDYFPEGKTVLTGNPRSQEVLTVKKVTKADLGLKEDKKLILIFMGSLGAEYVNETIVKTIPNLAKREDIEVIFVTGKSHYDNIISVVKPNNYHNIFIKPYVDNMPELYQHVDLLVCRAGATTLSEICAVGIPVILIPSPYVTNNHQEKNAADLVKGGGALMILEKDLNENILLDMINSLINDPYKLRLLRNNIKKMGIPNSCDLFIELIKSLK